jgi:hypothetical protein
MSKTVELVRKHINPKQFWKSDLETQINILKKLFQDLCSLYEIEDASIEIKIDPFFYRMTGGGCVFPPKRVVLYKVSLMTFLHEFAHLLFGHDEEKTNLWSHKVFYLAFPELYVKNAKESKFFHVVPLEKVMSFTECLK